jgi:transcriptional regulator with XRE-family HTH domain
MRGLDPALALRIRELRTSLKMPQGEFATKLGVIRTQVVEWEKGDRERPSFEKILEMAELAPNRELRMWFRRKAGVNLDAVRSDIEEERANSSEPQPQGDVIDIPFFGDLSVNRNGPIGRIHKGIISVPAGRVSQPDEVLGVLSAYRPPWVTSSDEIVFINTGVTKISNLRDRMAAVYFSCFPSSLRTMVAWKVPPHTPFGFDYPEPYLDPDKSRAFREAIREQYPDLEETPRQEIEHALRPGILVGWLHIECDSNDKPDGFGEGTITRWRIGLEARGPWSPYSRRIALSEWQMKNMPGPFLENPPNIRLKRGVRILGEVFGWIGVQSAIIPKRSGNGLSDRK